MFKEAFAKRLVDIEKALNDKNIKIQDSNKQLQQDMADLNVIIGAKAECEMWIMQLEQFEKSKASNKLPEEQNVSSGMEFNKPEEIPVTMDELKNMLGADSIELIDAADIKK